MVERIVPGAVKMVTVERVADFQQEGVVIRIAAQHPFDRGIEHVVNERRFVQNQPVATKTHRRLKIFLAVLRVEGECFDATTALEGEVIAGSLPTQAVERDVTVQLKLRGNHRGTKGVVDDIAHDNLGFLFTGSKDREALLLGDRA